jgi:hypothetical protein
MLQLIWPSCLVVSVRTILTCSKFVMVLSVSKVTDASQMHFASQMYLAKQ